MFAVVHFLKSREVEVVHKSWVFGNVCAWPPFKSNQVKQALLKGESPAPDWQSYDINLLGLFDSYKKAVQKSKLAEDTSNLETEASDDERKTRKDRKRKEMSNSESSESEIENIDLPMPGTLDKIHKKASNPRFFNVHSDVFSGKRYSPGNNVQSIMDHHMEQSTEKTANRTDQPTSTEKRLLCMMVEIQATLKNHSQILAQIMHILSKESVDNQNTGETFFTKLPIETMEEFLNFEVLIANESNFSRAVKYFGNKGNTEVKSVIRSIMQSMMTDDVAAQFNWAGRGEKWEFRSCKSRSLILYAVRGATKDAKATEVEEQIKLWLKYAPVRIQQKKKKKGNCETTE